MTSVKLKGEQIDPLQALGKVLRLEQEKGYKDVAVWGGMDRYLAQWRRHVQAQHPSSQAFLETMTLGGKSYSSLSIARRKTWVEDVLKRVGTAAPSSAPPPQAKAVYRKPPPSSQPTQSNSLEAPVAAVSGVNSRVLPKLHNLGVNTIRDLLYYFPRSYNDFAHMAKIGQLRVGVEQTVVANVWEARQVTLGKGTRSTEAVVGDDTGNIGVIWFNQPYLAKAFKPNTTLVLSGKPSTFKGSMVLQSPEYEVLDEKENLIHTGRLVPVYPLTEGLSPRTMRRIVKNALDRWLKGLPDPLPVDVKARHQLMDLPEAVKQTHYPDDPALLQKARHRLAFEELLLIQLKVLSQRQNWRREKIGQPVQLHHQLLDIFFSSLPFQLTSAQHRVLDEILKDMACFQPMSRLLQGEVGSGKTVVATAALLMAAVNQLQGALMAPTEILAEQHFINVSRLLSGLPRPAQNGGRFAVYLDPVPRPITIGLLTGSLPKSGKEEIYQALAQGEIDIIIGTHALIQEGVTIPRLALAIVDEQHRFGVMQRASLRGKGPIPHLLVMTATPIPRSLALTLYGDLDLSIIDELPPGRVPIKTKWIAPEQRQAAYNFLRKEVSQGRQAFVVCPLIEESEALQSRAATLEHQRLSAEVFPDLRLGLLHGRMPMKEKQKAMERFNAGGIDVLVSTPVIEVGIDVPNATVILVEGAERFGLSQLHQLRGRVQRSSFQSYCILATESPSAEAQERLSILERTNDGFQIAEEDLRLRGPGEFYGLRQSGLPDLRIASITDLPLLRLAREEAHGLLESDPSLQKKEHRELALALAKLKGPVHDLAG